jgi:Mce-associated membrane protein
MAVTRPRTTGAGMTGRLAGSPALLGATGLVAVAALGLGAHSGLALRDDHRETVGRAAAVAAASAEVTGLISVSDKTSTAEIDKLRGGATADFGSELEEQSTALRRALQSQKVTSTGSVASAGVVAWAPSKARVLVAAVGEVSNGSSAKATPRAYRLRVDLRNVEGRWLVSDMEFVS